MKINIPFTLKMDSTFVSQTYMTVLSFPLNHEHRVTARSSVSPPLFSTIARSV